MDKIIIIEDDPAIREELALPDVSDRELAALLVLAYSMTD